MSLFDELAKRRELLGMTVRQASSRAGVTDEAWNVMEAVAPRCAMTRM